MSLKTWITDSFFGGNRHVEYEKTKEGDHEYFTLGHGNYDMPYKTLFEIFRGIPHLRALLERKASMWSNARFLIKKTNTEEDEVDYKHKLNETLTNPNKLQSWRQMLFMLSLIKSIAGISFLYPGFGLIRKPRGLEFLKVIDFETYEIDDDKSKNFLTSDDVDEIIKYYRFSLLNGNSVKYKPSELLAFKDTFVDYLGNYSRITTNMLPLENIYKSLVNRGILMDTKGGIGALTGNQKDGGVAVPMKRKEKKSIYEKLKNFGLGRGKEPIIVTDVPMKFTPFVFPTQQLMLFEEIVDDFNTLCDGWGMARELFVGDAAYAATRKQAETDTYNNTIVPEWEDFFDTLNDGLHTREENIRIDLDVSHIAVLQKSEKENLETQSAKSALLMSEMDKGIIDESEYRQQMGYEKRKAS
jgi:hypothetical protein